MEKLRAVIYIRVSDESQIKNNSLETQLKACHSYADLNGLEVVKVFREEGVSAKHIHTRPDEITSPVLYPQEKLYFASNHI